MVSASLGFIFAIILVFLAIISFSVSWDDYRAGKNPVGGALFCLIFIFLAIIVARIAGI